MPAATYAAVWALAYPTIIEQVLQAIIGLTDTIIAGHMPGSANTIAAASAAVGVMTYLQWFAGLMTSAFSVGATAIVARSIGARRPRVANRVAGTALAAAFLVGLVVAIALFAFAPQVVALCGLRDQAALFGQQYLRIMAVTISLQTAGQIGMACLRGAGDTVRPMLITATVTVVNAISSSAFCFGWLGAPAWGIRGNAFGTMLAFLVGGTATLLVLVSGSSKLRLGWRHLRVVPHVLVRILRIGLPSWFEGLLLWTGQFLIVVLVINRNDIAIGVNGVTMAAHTAVLRIESIAFLPGFGFGIAASALVGQYLGSHLPEQARRAAHMANRLAFLTMTLAAIPMVLIPSPMLSLLVDSAPVVQTGRWPMVLAGLAQPGFAIAIVFGSALKGAGETVWPMFATITGMFLVRVPILLLGVLLFRRLGHPQWGLVAVWIGILIDLAYRAFFNGVVFWLGHWQRKRV
jgi:putative MATE family efflux protein